MTIVESLEQRAKAGATKTTTGQAFFGGVGVCYYPRCRRLAWFGRREGPITKQEAIRRLTTMSGRKP